MRRMPIWRGAALLLLLAVTARADVAATVSGSGLSQAPASVDALLDAFVTALATKDEVGLHRLRVNEAEYRGIIIPGTVKPGAPLRQIADEPSQYFWSIINQKSEDVARLLMLQFGGHTYTRKEMTFTRGVREFASYKALGDVRLKVEDEQGNTQEMRAGSIAEVGGHYKFIGFNTNN